MGFVFNNTSERISPEKLFSDMSLRGGLVNYF